MFSVAVNREKNKHRTEGSNRAEQSAMAVDYGDHRVLIQCSEAEVTSF
jgi:hypothetical protein